MFNKVLPALIFFARAVKNKMAAPFIRPLTNRIVIIRIDEIGDYILFRNFIKVLKQSLKFNGYKITLVGNKVWAPLAGKLDSDIVDDFIWIDPKAAWTKQHMQRLVEKIGNTTYTCLINPHTTRNWVADKLSMLITAKHKIVAECNSTNTTSANKMLANFFYNRIIVIDEKVGYEFLRTRFFIEQIINEKIDLNRPFINSSRLLLKQPAKKFIAVAPGANLYSRAWPTQNFIAAIKFILATSSFDVVLLGGKAELAMGEIITQSVTDKRLVNMIAETTLPELVDTLAAAHGAIANDTGIAHISGALNIKTICLVGGGHYERFLPYTVNSSVHCVYYKMDCYHCNWMCKYNIEATETFPCLQNISVTNVEKAIADYLLN